MVGLQLLCDNFEVRLKPIAFDISHRGDSKSANSLRNFSRIQLWNFEFNNLKIASVIRHQISSRQKKDISLNAHKPVLLNFHL